MAHLRTRRQPLAGQIWLSRPPYLMLAHVTDVDETSRPARISYELLDADGSVLDGPVNAVLDEGWWRTFQPMIRRWG
jgi:hypothetical protein